MDSSTLSFAEILAIALGIPFALIVIVCVLIFCCVWTNVANNGILNCCRRARLRRQQRREERQRKKIQQEEDRNNRRFERRVQQEVNRQRRDWVTAERQAQARLPNASMIEPQRPANVALSAVPSDHRFDSGSQQRTLGGSARVAESTTTYSRSQPNVRDRNDNEHIHRWSQRVWPGQPPDINSQGSSSGSPSRSRLQKQRQSHNLRGWTLPGAAPTSVSQGSVAESCGSVRSARLHKKSQGSIGATTQSSRQPLLV